MTYTLDIGAGPHSTADVQIDLVKHNDRTRVLDVAVHDLPFHSNTFDEVRLEQVLEHIPTQYRWFENGKHHLRLCRVRLMMEVWRVLRVGGIAHISVPIDWPQWAQDPTHADVPWNEHTFGYFTSPMHSESYGITNFFKMQSVQHSPEHGILTVRLRK